MNWLDIVILAVGGFIALAGTGMGGIQIGVTGAGIMGGIALAGHLHSWVEPISSRFIDSDDGARFAAFAAIFIVVLIASVVVGFMVRAISRRLMLGWVDKVLGLGLGVIVSFAIGSAVLSAIQSYPIFSLDETIGDSTLGSFLADNFDIVLRGLKFIPGDLGT